MRKLALRCCSSVRRCGLIIGLCLAWLPGIAQTAPTAAPAVTPNQATPVPPEQAARPVQTLEIPAGQRVVLTAQGKGVQIYRCDRVKDLWGWVLVAPEATLFVSGVKVGTHSAGPSWTYRNSSVKGKVLTSVPSPDADSIPWLLLEALDATGADLLNDVSYIRRADTKGGKAGSTGCDAGHAGAVSRIPYSATYTFYSPGADGAEVLPKQ